MDEAQSHLEQLAQEDPTSGQINLLLGRLAVQQHKLKQAVDYYQRGVYEYWPQSEFPQRRQARWELATLLSKTGDRSGFIAELMQLYTNLPVQDIAQKLKVGFLLLANGATSEASRIFQDLVKQAPQNAEAHRGLGEAHFSNGDYVSARHELQRALRLNPNNKESMQTLSVTNDVIDMDPALPYIGGFEQVRRSRNLLSRVIKDIEECDPGSGAADSACRMQEICFQSRLKAKTRHTRCRLPQPKFGEIRRRFAGARFRKTVHSIRCLPESVMNDSGVRDRRSASKDLA